MNGAARRRSMAGIVVCVALWPAVHAALVAHFGTDPWELFGWSMYTVPQRRIQIGVEVERDGAKDPLRAMGAARRRVQDFARRRTALGRLASTEPLARAILAEDPSIDAVVIVTREVSFDPDTTRIVARDETHRHERTESTLPGRVAAPEPKESP